MGNRSKGSGKRRKQHPKPSQQHVPDGDLRNDEQESRTLELMLQQRSGPLPDPQTLHEYDQVHPGAAERIIARFEEQTRHRHQIEKRVLEAQIVDEGSSRTERRVGQICAVVVAMGAFFASAFCAYVDQPWPASVIGGGTLVALVTAFLKGREPSGSSVDGPDAEKK